MPARRQDVLERATACGFDVGLRVSCCRVCWGWSRAATTTVAGRPRHRRTPPAQQRWRTRVETTAPSVDSTERPVDTFEPPVTTTAPSGAVLFDGDDFYAVPEPLPAGEPGTLLRYEPIDVFGGWSNFGDSPGEFGLQTLGTVSGEVVIWRDPVAVRTERVDRPVPDDAVGRSAQELATWLAEHPQLEATDPAPVSVGGLDGFEVEIAIAPTSTNTPATVPAGGGVRGPVRATASRVRLAARHPR